MSESRPEHSLVSLSTTPASEPISTFPNQYTSYSQLATTETETSKRPSRYYLIYWVVFAILSITFLSRYATAPTPSQEMRERLSPFLPAKLANLLQSQSPESPSSHNIISLINQANQQWSSLINSQSTTFDKAQRTYKARYSLPPPPGFDKWFAFATQGRNHTLIDEYDTLMQDLAPFRALDPAELRRRTAELAKIPGISIVSIRDGVAVVHSRSGKWAPALAFQQMIKDFVHDLPDMDVAINEKAEGRVLPRKQRTVNREEFGLEDDLPVLNTTIVDPMITPSLAGFKAEWDNDGSVWESFRRSCPTDSPSRRLVESVRSAESGLGLVMQGRAGKSDQPTTRRKSTGLAIPPARELSFSTDIDGSYDVCARPSIHSLHSAFFSDQRSIGYLYPVFSPSKPSGFSDILIPSHHYWSPSSESTYEWDLKKGGTAEPTDVEWALKKSSVYWRGKVTRGADSPPGHAGSFQKQRLVKMANDATFGAERVLVAFDTKTGSLTSTAASVANVNNALLDIAMACVVDFGECAYLRSLGYRVEPPGPLSETWKHKYVLDLDEIGFSPKFLALMESKSAVVKSSMQREFWKGWIVPWKHYIPLSSSYAELYNIHTFFSGFPTTLRTNLSEPLAITTLTRPYSAPELPLTANGYAFTGDQALKDIADAGRDWQQNYARKEDMECYVYRLMIEWAAMTTIA